MFEWGSCGEEEMMQSNKKTKKDEMHIARREQVNKRASKGTQYVGNYLLARKNPWSLKMERGHCSS